MTTTLALSFPWGLYHATPWGRDVNEAEVEWPPSPWRLLRALYATWRWRVPDIDAALVEGLLGELALPPSYLLPAHAEAHTRHYMPDSGDGTDKVFDAFVVVERGAQALVRWPFDLEARHRDVLAELAGQLSYLGRAESLCEAQLLDSPSAGPRTAEPAGAEAWLDPVDNPQAAVPGTRTPRVRLLSPCRPLDVAALTVRTSDVRGAGLTMPLGARWVTYPLPERSQPRPAPRAVTQRRPTALRWAFASPAQPSVRAAVAVCDVLRQACMAQFGRRREGAASPVLAGKGTDGAPLQGHRHAHYLPVDADGDRLVDHLILWAPSGLGPEEVAALTHLDRLVGYARVSDFRPGRLGLEALGNVEDVAPELAGPARQWKSLTPFAPPRHAHKNQTWDAHVCREVSEELDRRSLPAPRAVRLVPGDWLSYRRHRIREGLEDARRAVGVEIVFGEAVTGPLALGALSHFGLGLLVPFDG